MANNPNVNKVVYGNQTVMDISDTTAEEGDVVTGKTFYKASGARSTGSAVIPDISNCYQTTDTAETDIQDTDYFPFYDTSATAKRKSLWSNIKAKLKAYFDNVYATLASPAFTGTPTAPTALYSADSTQIATTAFVQSAIRAHYHPYFLLNGNVTASSGTVVRVPSSGTNSHFYPGLTEVYIPVAYSDTPIKFSKVQIHDGYGEITLAQAVSNADIGFMIFD